MRGLIKDVERTEQRLRELKEQNRLKDLDEERLQRENEAKCDECGFTFVIEEGHGIFHPNTGEPMACPKCKNGIMKDRNLFKEVNLLIK